VAAVRAHWGLGSRLLSDIFLGGCRRRGTGTLRTVAARVGDGRNGSRVLELVYRLDVRAHLPLVRQPATVVHRRDDRAVPYRLGREVAAAIPGATFIPLQGSSHFPWHGDVDSVVRACRQALTQQQSRPTEAGELEPALLSDRERQILACVARGLGDREIAEQLVLSPHTVHRHVANIRRKLGRPSRSAAVAEAARLGLCEVAKNGHPRKMAVLSDAPATRLLVGSGRDRACLQRTDHWTQATSPYAAWLRIMAVLYDPFLWLGEVAGMRRRRRTLLAEAYGRVVEIGAGTGLNVAHYPDAVTNSCSPNPNLECAGNSLGARPACTHRAHP